MRVMRSAREPCQARRLVVLGDPAPELRRSTARSSGSRRAIADAAASATSSMSASRSMCCSGARASARARRRSRCRRARPSPRASEELPDVDVADGERRAAGLAGRARRRSPRRPGSSRPIAVAAPTTLRAAVPHQPEGLGRRAAAGARGLSVHALQDVRHAAPPRACRRRRRCPCRRARARRSRPRATSRRSGATPAARRRFEEALCTTVAPVRASSSMSASRSQTPWASALRSPSTPVVGQPLELAASGEGIAPGPLQAALERVQMDAGAELAAAAEPTASTSASLAHCGAMIANWALSSGSPASSPHERLGSSRCTPRRACASARCGAPAPAARPAATAMNASSPS